MYARGSNRFASFVQTIVSTSEAIADAVAAYLTEHPVDISGKVDKVTGKSLVSDTEIAKISPAYSHSQSAHLQFSGLAKITVGTTQPANPSTGDLWINTNT